MRNKMIKCFVLIFFVSAAVNADNLDSLINQVVPAYPADTEVYEASCISEALGAERGCDASIEVLKFKNGNPISILAEKVIKNNLQGTSQSHWLVTDQVQYPKIGAGESLVLAHCRLNGKLDRTILAVVVQSKTEWLEAKGWARKVDLSTGKFLIINASGIQCENLGWGL
jgi:hypothetical protein